MNWYAFILISVIAIFALWYAYSMGRYSGMIEVRSEWIAYMKENRATT